MAKSHHVCMPQWNWKQLCLAADGFGKWAKWAGLNWDSHCQFLHWQISKSLNEPSMKHQTTLTLGCNHHSTHPDSSDRLHRSHMTQYYWGYWKLEYPWGTLRVFLSHSYIARQEESGCVSTFCTKSIGCLASAPKYSTSAFKTAPLHSSSWNVGKKISKKVSKLQLVICGAL